MAKAAPQLDTAALMQDVQRAMDDSAAVWQRYTCRLLTPMYGGGVEPGVVDPGMPIRATAIRGQLRAWWRLLNRRRTEYCREGKPDSALLFAAEREIWGGLGDEKTLAASKVVVKVTTLSSPVLEAGARHKRKANGKVGVRWLDWASPYAMFPAQGEVDNGQSKKPPARFACEGLRWEIHLGFRELTADSAEFKSVEEAFRWWATFGGVGARTRRGLGAFEVTSSANGEFSYVSSAEVGRCGWQLLLQPAADSALAAWQSAVEALRSFRQQPGVARDRSAGGHPGRSRWPEADAIRRTVRSPSRRHPPRHAAGDVFPRAAFGLPIVFHFKDDDDDPQDTQLVPVVDDQRRDRMASPLIVRPYRAASGQWHPALLCLPSDHVWTMAVELVNSGRATNQYLPKQFARGVWWPQVSDPGWSLQAAVDPSLPPHRTDALTAFQSRFSAAAPKSPGSGASGSPPEPAEERWPKARITVNRRNGTVTAVGPHRQAHALGEKGEDMHKKLSPLARSKIARGFFQAVAIVKGKELLRIEEDQ